MKQIFCLLVFLSPIYLNGQHHFGLGAGLSEISLTNLNTSFYGSGIYKKVTDYGFNYGVEARYAREEIRFHDFRSVVETQFHSKIRMIPFLELKLSSWLFWQIGADLGRRFGIEKRDRRPNPLSSIVRANLSPWDTSLMTGFQLYQDNYFLSIKVNYQFTQGTVVQVSDIVGDNIVVSSPHSRIQIGVGYLFDPKEKLAKFSEI